VRVWKMADGKLNNEMIEEAADFLRRGKLVAFPTETVYGLGGDGLNAQALLEIFQAKGRPADNPLILHIWNEAQLQELVSEIPDPARQLMAAFWPGPLTLVLPKSAKVPLEATAGLMSVAVRMPSHPLALALIEKAGCPIAAPSANLSGKPSPTEAQAVIEDLDGKIAGIIDGGRTEIGLESTVVDCTGRVPVILRPGGITAEMLTAVLEEVEIDPGLLDEKAIPKAPGMKYTHYAPAAKVVILEDKKDLAEALAYGEGQSGKCAFLVPEDVMPTIDERFLVVRKGRQGEWQEFGAHFYETLRRMDREQIEEIFVYSVPEKGLGTAIMNRMRKAAGYRFWKNEKEAAE
jgi:Sua5/YciO/YrdC/YwlC family protein